MLRSGNRIHPALHHEQPRFRKPPITHWLIASSLDLFGRAEQAVRDVRQADVGGGVAAIEVAPPVTGGE
jgi:4-amino-4-deoxy-L-arabinose transferase-like glycosyltransferase